MTSTPLPSNGPAQNTGPSSGTPGGLLSRLPKPQPAPPVPPAQPVSRFASSNSRLRLGANPLTWEVLPLGETLVCFSLEGLGGSLKYLMGDDLQDTGGSYEVVLQSIENDVRAIEKLKTTLEDVWSGYRLKGAMLVYPWKNTTRDVILASAKMRNVRPIFLRAFDPLLVMNVLARSRENLLQPRAPLSFDKAYLERALVSDDPRLMRLVQISSYFEEVIQTPQIPSEEEAEDG